jgi:hypothetical protein
MGNGMVPQSDSMANHAVGLPSHQLMAYVPAPVLLRVKERPYSVSIAIETKKVEHHHANVDFKDSENGLAEELPPNDNDHRSDLDDLANNPTTIQQRSVGSEAESKHDEIIMRGAVNALVNMHASMSKNQGINAWKSPIFPSKSSLAVDALSSPNRNDFDDSFAPVCRDDTDKRPSSPGHHASNLSHVDEVAQHLDNTGPNSSGGVEMTVDKHAQGYCSRLGWSADSSAREMVQTDSYRSSRGASSTDLPLIQMTQPPAFDYFSQVSHSGWPSESSFSDHD